VDRPKRKHVATGKRPPGGKREGAGRPPGGALLEYGESSAIRAMKLRLPADAPEEHVQLAGEALETIIKVMRGEVSSLDAANRRNAAKDLREEICKPIPKPVALTDAEGNSLTVNIISLADVADE
jgi:hypothetical protein